MVSNTIVEEYGIKGFPTIKVFVPGKLPVDYQGAREVKPIAEFALQQVAKAFDFSLAGASLSPNKRNTLLIYWAQLVQPVFVFLVVKETISFVTDEEVTLRESILRDALKNDPLFQVIEGASVEVAKYNPPFTLPFTHHNEVALEFERKSE